jgi:hypothetical protein
VHAGALVLLQVVLLSVVVTYLVVSGGVQVGDPQAFQLTHPG